MNSYYSFSSEVLKPKSFKFFAFVTKCSQHGEKSKLKILKVASMNCTIVVACQVKKKANTFFYFDYYAKTKHAYKKDRKNSLSQKEKACAASINTKRSSSTEMALRVFGALLFLSLAFEFSSLCEGQYQCLFTSCRKREVRQLKPTK